MIRLLFVPRTVVLSILLVVAALAAVVVAPVRADWPTDPSTNLVISDTPGVSIYNIDAVSDGAGGSIVAWDQPSGESELFGVDFVDVNTGITVGAGGSIRATTNGGTTWSDQSSGTASTLRSVSMVDASTAFACGDNGTILRTTDGGMNWTALTSGTASTLRSISMVSATTGLAVGDTGVMLRTTDGGANWASVSVSSENLYGVVFIDANAICVVGLSGTVIRSNSGGNTWILQTSGTAEHLYAVDFIDANNGFAVGSNGVVLKTTDAGVNWSASYPTLNFYDFYAVSMASATHGIATGEETIRTTNGSSWLDVYPPSAGDYRGVEAVDASNGTIVGVEGYITNTSNFGSTWIVQSGARDVYAQRVSPHGDLMWGAGGVALSVATDNQTSPRLTADGAGGAIVVWTDARLGTSGYRMYAQRVDGDGVVQWAADGLEVLDVSAGLTQGALVSNGSGGAIFVFGKSGDIYAQGIDAGGNTWATGGVPICTDPASQSSQVIVSDGLGGAIMAWRDYRNGNYDIYMQRVDGNGTPIWTNNGRAIASEAHSEQSPQLGTSSEGGAVLMYESDLGTGAQAMVVQRLNEYGGRAWGTTGVVLRDLSTSAFPAAAVPDGQGGVIGVWGDYRNSNWDIYARRVTGAGTLQWSTNGSIVCNVATPQNDVFAAPDGAGGVIVAWEDERVGCCASTDIYAQRLLYNGARVWDYEGVAIGTAVKQQLDPIVVPDDLGGAIIVFRDRRQNDGVYCQRVEGEGFLGYPAPSIDTVVDSPADQGGKAIVSWTRSYLDAFPHNEVTDYSVWRRLETGMAAASATLAEPDPRALAAGVEENLAAQMAAAGWAYIDQVPAARLDEYAYEAPTYGDSTGTENPITGYQVIAHTNDPNTFWTSLPASGFSVDNLSPSAPLMLAGERIAPDVDLHWKPGTTHYEDLSHYAVYRDVNPGFTPGPGNFIGTTVDTMLVDPDPGPSTLYYKVRAVDIHENPGAASNEVEIQGTPTGVRTPSLPVAFTIMPNHPNPFTRSTTLRFGLPASSEVSIDVYDVAGRRVYSDRITRGAGWHTYQFAGQSGGSGGSGRYSGGRLPSGVYFYKLTAGGETQTRKMVLTR